MKDKQNKCQVGNKIFELLIDNSPKAYPEYEQEAAILDKQIKTPNVNNIAIVAKYGAGKSSLIATYLDKYRNKSLIKKIKDKISKVIYKINSNLGRNVINEVKTEKDLNNSVVEKSKSTTRFEYANSNKKHKCLNKNTAKLAKKNKYVRVSLSTFNDNDFEESDIEQSVLQQLLYSRKKEKFPNSEIVRTNKTSIWRPFFLSIILVLWICSIVLFALDMSGIKLIDIYWTTFAYAAIFVITLFALIFIGIRYHKLKKINYKNIEVEFSKKDEPQTSNNNLINKFINEVLYYFECVNVDLVIFEDLERLKTSEIFVKLRELNTIINNSRKRYGKVTFLYAVKDELFKTEEERAKFFEFILPITPVINPMTTKVEIGNRNKKIKEINSQMELLDKFIKGVSLYIPDMRILNNVFNDYIIMYSKIMEDEKAPTYLKNENLFALCVYKNLFPYDYALLEKNSGLIPSIINLDYLRKKYATSLEKQKVKINDEIENAKKETLNSFEELRTVFIERIRNKAYNYNRYGTIDLKTIATFEGLTYDKVIHPNHSNYSIEIDNYEKDIVDANGVKFIDRERQIKNKETQQLNKLKIELSEINLKLQQIANYTMNDIVRNSNEDFYFEKKITENYKLELNDPSNNQKKVSNKIFEEQISYLKFLLINDYIDEHYIEYISSYQSDTICTADIQVAKSIQINSVNFNANVNDVMGLVKWLDDEDFCKESIIIKQLLLKIEEIRMFSQNEKDGKFNNLIKLLSDKNKNNVLELLNSYFETTDEIDYLSLLKYFLSNRPSLLAELIGLGKLEKSKLDSILVSTINYVEDYTLVDNNDILKKYINSNDEYITIFNRVDSQEKVKIFLKNLELKFENVQNININNEIQRYIIENNYYRITLNNLEEICTNKCGIKTEEFKTQNYTAIKESEFDWLKNYIEDNINEYVEQILLNNEVSLENESKENIISLLKNENLDLGLRKALIEKIHFAFDNLDEINIELLPEIFKFNKVVADWSNIYYAYDKKGFECICIFVKNANNIVGSFSKNNSVDEAKTISLLNSILINFDTASINKICAFIDNTFDLKQLNFKDIPDENLSEFISFGKISYSDCDFVNLIEKEKSLTEYLKLYDDDVITHFDEFFSKNIFKKVRKTSYYGYQDNTYVKQLLPQGQDFIARIVGLHGINLEIKRKLINVCEDLIIIQGHEEIYKDYIIKEKQIIPKKILWQFTDAINITNSEKKKILNNCISMFKNDVELDNVKNFVSNIGPNWSELFEGVILVDDNNENREFIKVLNCFYDLECKSKMKKGEKKLAVSIK